MTYDQLLTLDYIVKEGSFKAAAEAMHKSQPSLSVAIKKLEEELGFELFDRNEYRPRLNEKGRAFYQRALITLEGFHTLYSFGKELALGYEPEVKISIDAVFPIGKLRDIFSGFFAPHITTTLSLSIDILEGSTEKVVKGLVDFAISSYLVESEELESIKLLDVFMSPCIARDALESRTIEEAIAVLPQIIVKSSTQKPSDVMLGLYPKSKKWFTSDLSMKIELIKNGLGWGRIPCHLIEADILSGNLLEIKNVPSIHNVNIPLFLLRNKKKLLGPNAKQLWNFIREHFKQQ